MPLTDRELLNMIARIVLTLNILLWLGFSKVYDVETACKSKNKRWIVFALLWALALMSLTALILYFVKHAIVATNKHVLKFMTSILMLVVLYQVSSFITLNCTNLVDMLIFIVSLIPSLYFYTEPNIKTSIPFSGKLKVKEYPKDPTIQGYPAGLISRFKESFFG